MKRHRILKLQLFTICSIQNFRFILYADNVRQQEYVFLGPVKQRTVNFKLINDPGERQPNKGLLLWTYKQLSKIVIDCNTIAYFHLIDRKITQSLYIFQFLLIHTI